MEIGAVTVAVSVDFLLGHGELGNENIIKMTREVTIELVVGNDVGALGNAEVTSDELAIDNDLIRNQNENKKQPKNNTKKLNLRR